MFDPEEIVISWNPGAQRFKGYLASQIDGRFYSFVARTLCIAG
jgi:hypothetical protein